MQRRSILNGELAMAIKALTAVSRVISFLNLSRKIGRQEESSACSESPRWATTWPIQEMALSFTCKL